MRFAYADPPYLGMAHRYEGGVEVNHALLLAHLNEFDAWALSCHSPSLKVLLPLCPDDVRVAAWVKPFAVFKPNVNPAYAWEPIIFRGGRKRTRQEPTVADWVSACITLERGVVGAKPDAFCYWLFELLGAEPTDDFVDIFPGSGAVTRAWAAYRQQTRMAYTTPAKQLAIQFTP